MNKIENLNNYLDRINMVHTWISLQNDSINSPCLNKRILRIFRNESVNFYGDYNLDIYIGTKHDYSNIEEVISKVKLLIFGKFKAYLKVKILIKLENFTNCLFSSRFFCAAKSLEM